MIALLVCALAAALAAPLGALDTLVVGGGERRWDALVESARFVGVSPDSIWTWHAERGDNLAVHLGERGGMVGAVVQVPTITGYASAISRRAGIEAWVDGDAATAWSPEQDADVARRGVFYIDLGATFRVDRIRFYPRLDSEHRSLVLGSFEVASNDGEQGSLLESPYRTIPGLNFSSFAPNRQPMVEARFPRRDVRFVRLRSQTGEPWELAEFEIYAEGSLPPGEFVTVPLFIRGGYPIWGRMLYEGGPIEELPIAVQTRTGPDDEPLHYFLQRGDELEQVARSEYQAFDPLDFAGAAEVQLGPIRPNPQWSTWQALGEGLVLSPAPRRYIQLRLELSEPGTALKNILLEYVEQPLAAELVAEIAPIEVAAGAETEFVLALQVQLDTGRGDTGFRYVQVRSPASIGRVRSVRVDDEEALFTASYDAEGFTVDIWKRVEQSGTFIQIAFSARLLRDGTPFEVRALDLRPSAGTVERVYQTARPGDIDPLSVGGQLQVRLRPEDRALIDDLAARTSTFSPNGDGINDVFEISYNLLKLTQPTPVHFQIYDLAGQQVAQGRSIEYNGRFVRVWRGQDGSGQRVQPGLYLYQIAVEADVGTLRHQGVVSVVY